eukprot:1088188-Pyramimonas_sp.AAC.1
MSLMCGALQVRYALGGDVAALQVAVVDDLLRLVHVGEPLAILASSGATLRAVVLEQVVALVIGQVAELK